eukprot:scaffold70199_cov58-Phaeocystis_antarctica.AAC.3
MVLIHVARELAARDELHDGPDCARALVGIVQRDDVVVLDPLQDSQLLLHSPQERRRSLQWDLLQSELVAGRLLSDAEDIARHSGAQLAADLVLLTDVVRHYLVCPTVVLVEEYLVGCQPQKERREAANAHSGDGAKQERGERGEEHNEDGAQAVVGGVTLEGQLHLPGHIESRPEWRAA